MWDVQIMNQSEKGYGEFIMFCFKIDFNSMVLGLCVDEVKECLMEIKIE